MMFLLLKVIPPTIKTLTATFPIMFILKFFDTNNTYVDD